MRITLTSLALATALAVSATTVATAKDANPIFGGAKAQTLSKTENQKVVGKGAYADYFGYYGNLYSSYAYYYGSIGYYNTDSYSGESSNYYNAYYYASLSTNNYLYAYYYAGY